MNNKLAYLHAYHLYSQIHVASNCIHSTCIGSSRIYASFDSYSQTGKFDILIVPVINWITRTVMGVNVPVQLRQPTLNLCDPLVFAVIILSLQCSSCRCDS